MQVIKVFVSGAEQQELVHELEDRDITIRHRYEAFLLLEVTEADFRELSERFRVDDITASFLPDPGDAEALSTGPHHYLLQFDGLVIPAWLRDVEDAGGTVRAPYADFSFVVLADEAAVDRIAAHEHVQWIRHLPHKDRISDDARARVEELAGAGDQTLGRVFNVVFFDHQDTRDARERVGELGFEVLELIPKEEARPPAGPWPGTLVVRDDPERGDLAGRLEALSAVHGVRQIWPAFTARVDNDVAVGLMGTARSAAPPDLGQGLGLDGSGECVAIADGGFDTGDVNALCHPDFANRVLSIKAYPVPPGAAAVLRLQAGADLGTADSSGHGTHVAGSVLGDGTASAGLPGLDGPVRGLAHRATLIFQALGHPPAASAGAGATTVAPPDPGTLAGLPTNIYWDLFQNAYDQGARVAVCAWSEPAAAGKYTPLCEQVDRFIWDHKDFCIVVAAGNGGTSYGPDGISQGTVQPVGTAKNCITVGASENRRPGLARTYGQDFPRASGASRFADQPMAADENRLAVFSGTGRTQPNQGFRVKPDVVAPGTLILSARSSELGPGSTGLCFDGSAQYCYMTGTSQATALVAGAVALIRQYLRAYFGTRDPGHDPTAALVKAALIAGARRLPGPDGLVVDAYQGYGRVDLDAVLSPPAPARTEFLDSLQAPGQGEHPWSLPVVVRSRGAPLRVVMAYTDPPSARLVNNLNLSVCEPGSGPRVCHQGNDPSDGNPPPDMSNNVEVVHVVDPSPGTWQVEVKPTNVPPGPQDFALVVCGDIDPFT